MDIYIAKDGRNSYSFWSEKPIWNKKQHLFVDENGYRVFSMHLIHSVCGEDIKLILKAAQVKIKVGEYRRIKFLK